MVQDEMFVTKLRSEAAGNELHEVETLIISVLLPK